MYTYYVEVNNEGVVRRAIQYGGKYNTHYPNGVETDWVQVSEGFDTTQVYDTVTNTWSPAPDTRTYEEKRREAYLPIGDQLDQQYHDLLDGTTTWKDGIAAVKALYPKPTT